MKSKRILIIDDERSLLESLEMFLTEKAYKVSCATTAAEGLLQNTTFDPHVIILDVRLPDMNGLDVLRELTNQGKKNIIIITAFHDMDITIKTVKLGAFDYIPKPIDVDELEKAINKALKSTDPGRSGSVLSIETTGYSEGQIIGKSKPMKEIFKTIGVLSENRVTVLIEGETGTGKELIAWAIHHNSPCKDNPFRAISCSTIVGTLLESELFGHEKGAFTGASSSKKGKFELAGAGTIFLDEIGEIPFELQSKLLRFLQEKEFERLGGERTIKSMARVIAATNRDLWKMAEEGTFREDLYYRLNVAAIKIPPLRERKSDIPLLVEYILRKINRELGKNIKKIEGEALQRLTEYDWPGNVRELENILTHAAINTTGEVILEDLITPLLGKKLPNHHAPLHIPDKEQSLDDIEKSYIIGVLNRTHWHLGKTCEILGISRPTLRHKLKEYSIPNDLSETA
ncbi:MAG: sigma-54-dependent Fis family transcriptional regulator [Syntrophus sp. (in: bacteria)]|nr:sigma-54-dependent Fis family transcriptional regulator [Syntrophus sp. (in: bacteria)]